MYNEPIEDQLTTALAEIQRLQYSLQQCNHARKTELDAWKPEAERYRKETDDLREELDSTNLMLGRWISYDGHVCPNCGRPHGELE